MLAGRLDYDSQLGIVTILRLRIYLFRKKSRILRTGLAMRGTGVRTTSVDMMSSTTIIGGNEVEYYLTRPYSMINTSKTIL